MGKYIVKLTVDLDVTIKSAKDEKEAMEKAKTRLDDMIDESHRMGIPFYYELDEISAIEVVKK